MICHYQLIKRNLFHVSRNHIWTRGQIFLVMTLQILTELTNKETCKNINRPFRYWTMWTVFWITWKKLKSERNQNGPLRYWQDSYLEMSKRIKVQSTVHAQYCFLLLRNHEMFTKRKHIRKFNRNYKHVLMWLLQ